jgi:hypothetical protein
MKRLAILLLVAGCGSPSTQDVDQLIQQMAAQQCEWEFRCCTDAEINQLDGTKFTASGDCTPYRALALQTELYLHRLAASEGRLKVDQTQATACIAQMQAKACNGDPKQAMVGMFDPMEMDACAKVWVGTTPAGHECIYQSECEQGARCIADASAVGRGVCVPFQHVDDICNVDADCDPSVKNIYCAKADYHCHVRGTFGQPCQYTTDSTGKAASLPLLLECDNTYGNAYCDVKTSTCKQLPVDGDPCLDPLPPGIASACNPDPKLGLVCDHGGSTSTTGGICRAPAGLGESCKTLSCAADLYCDNSIGSYVCKALPGFGQPCSTTGYRCATPFFCAYNVGVYTCSQPASIGENCTSPARSCNTDAYCDTSGTRNCEPLLGDGATCTSSIQCVSGNCSIPTGGTHQVCGSKTTAVACSGH